MVVSHLGINIKSINIIQVFWNSTCLLEITYLVESALGLVVVTIIFSNDVLDFLLGSIPLPVSFQPF